MKRLLFVLLMLFAILPAHAQGVTVISSTQASAEPHSDGQWYLVLTGDAASITHICAFGDCRRGFASRFDALNAWTGWIGLSAGGTLAPLPAPPAYSVASILASPILVPLPPYPCAPNPCIYPPRPPVVHPGH